jgi:hypothetical protein
MLHTSAHMRTTHYRHYHHTITITAIVNITTIIIITMITPQGLDLASTACPR